MKQHDSAEQLLEQWSGEQKSRMTTVQVYHLPDHFFVVRRMINFLTVL